MAVILVGSRTRLMLVMREWGCSDVVIMEEGRRYNILYTHAVE